ncbi:MAG TPA: S41 family peptidase [Alphaproteobacteria bacterium]
MAPRTPAPGGARPLLRGSVGLWAAVAVVLIAASCNSHGLSSRPLGFSHASFDSTAKDYPELAEVSAAFDRNVAPRPDADLRQRQLDLFAEVLDITRGDYVEPVAMPHMIGLAVEGFDQVGIEADLRERADAPATDAEDEDDELTADNLMSAGLDRMLSKLDSHSGYLSPERYREMKLRTRGEFGGIGIEVTVEDGLVKVVAPIDESPGQRAGLQAGDLITHVDGTSVFGMSLEQAVNLMRGPAGSRVVLELRRPPATETFRVAIVRDTVRIQAVRAHAEGDIGYVRITTFNEQAEEALRRAVKDLRGELGKRMAGLVIDLRNNPGGLLDQALGVSDAFLSGGEIVSTRGRERNTVRRFSAEGGDIADGLPIVVLINGGSASASEIVSGSLQDHQRAVVIGTRSFGKGSVQTIIPVSGGGAVRLTTARYFTPSGRSIQLSGIVPDIVVGVDEAGMRREADLENPLPSDSADVTGTAKLTADQACPTSGQREDPILACAVELLESRATVAAGLSN